MQVEPGSTIAGRYDVVKRIGAGGMGMVFQATDRELNNATVALKLLLPHLASDEQIFKRFLNEVLVARSLSHPNIVRIHDIGKAEDGYYYISMEMVDGYSLKERISTEKDAGSSGATQQNFKPLTFKEAMQILYDIASGVSYAHTKGVLHRDLKPGNVLISKKGEVKLADFGTARIMGMDTSLTQTGQVIGTPDYMSPEQIRGESLDASCDIYSLGIIGYELVTGCRPYIADSAVAVAFKHLSEPLPPFGEKLKHIPNWYRVLIEKATAKDRTQRYQNGREFLLDLQKHLAPLGESYSGGSFSAIQETGRFELGDSGSGGSTGNDWKFGDSNTPPIDIVTPKSSGGNLFLILLLLVTLGLGYGFFTYRDQLIPIENLSVRNPELKTEEIARQIERLPEKPLIPVEQTPTATDVVAVSSTPVLISVETPTPAPTPLPTQEPTATPTASPTATPTEIPTKTPTPTPTPTEIKKEVSVSLLLKSDGIVGSEFSSESLNKITWEISIQGLTTKELDDMLINLVNATQGTLVTRVRPNRVSTREGKLHLVGRFEGIAKTLQPDRYRLDVHRNGELLASARFTVIKKEEPVEVAATPDATPVASTLEVIPTSEVEVPVAQEVVTKNYSGNIELPGEDGLTSRSMTLNLVFQGLEISGSGSIQGFGEMTVSGKELVRGYEISLRGNELQLRLTSGKGATGLRGSYLVAGKPIRGAWQVRLVP